MARMFKWCVKGCGYNKWGTCTAAPLVEYERALKDMEETIRKEAFHEKTSIVVDRAMAAKKLKPEAAKQDLEKLRRLSVNVGLESLAKSAIDPLVTAVENPEKAEEIFGTKDLKVGVNSRIKALLESL